MLVHVSRDDAEAERVVPSVSTRAVDDLVQALGLSGASKSEVSRICREIDERVNAFLARPIAASLGARPRCFPTAPPRRIGNEGAWPYLWLDATYVHVREQGRIVSTAVIIATAVTTDGRREVLGMATGPSEAEPFWTDFLRSLANRGLRGVKLIVADDRKGLRAAATKVLHATLQRCRVPWLRNLCSAVSRRASAPCSPPCCA